MEQEEIKVHQRSINQFYMVYLVIGIATIIIDLLSFNGLESFFVLTLKGLILWGILVFKKKKKAIILGVFKVLLTLITLSVGGFVAYLLFNTIVLGNGVDSPLIVIPQKMTPAEKLKVCLVTLVEASQTLVLPWILLYNADKAVDYARKKKKTLVIEAE